MIEDKIIIDGLRERLNSIDRELLDANAEFSRLQNLIPKLKNRREALNSVINTEFGSDEFADLFSELDDSEDDKQHPVETYKDKIDGSDTSSHIIINNLGSNDNGARIAQIIPQRQRKGLKDTVRKHFSELPQDFTKHNVVKILLREHRGLKTVNENTLSGVMRDLVEKGLAKIKTHSVGKTAQVYEKAI